MQWRKITKGEQADIISKKLENPELSVRDISSSTWIAKSTVANTINEAPEILESLDSTDKVNTVLQTLDSIIDNWNKIIDRFIRMAEWEQDEMIPIKSYNDLTAISWIQERSWKQRQIIKWDVTDRVAYEDLSSLTPKQLEQERNRLL